MLSNVYTLFSREEPFVFQIGRQQMIEGWEKGLLDMCVGEKRKLVVPSDMVCFSASHRIQHRSITLFIPPLSFRHINCNVGIW